MKREAFAPGKIILTGEYAVVFGYAGVAIPIAAGVHATFEENLDLGRILIHNPNPYVEKIVAHCVQHNQKLSGVLTVLSDIPIGKGVGSSSATVIAIVRALLGEDSRTSAQTIEESLTPGVSGIDFTTSWERSPIVFRRGSPGEKFTPMSNFLDSAILIDTGRPQETTSELVAWVKTRKTDVELPLSTIGRCTERLLAGDALHDIIRSHHQAQISLGVVPQIAQDLISELEEHGHVGKVIGAGGRRGGAGLVFALGDKNSVREIAMKHNMPILPL